MSTLDYSTAGILLSSLFTATFIVGMQYGIRKGKEDYKKFLQTEKFHISYDVFNSWRSKLGKPLGGVGQFYLEYLRENLEPTRNYAKKENRSE